MKKKKESFWGWLTNGKMDIWAWIGLAWICLGLYAWYTGQGWFAK